MESPSTFTKIALERKRDKLDLGNLNPLPVVSREYDPELDFQRVMAFLRDSFAESGSLHNWLPPRFEGSRAEMAEGIRLWEDVGRVEPEIVAVATPEERFTYFIQRELHGPPTQYLLCNSGAMGNVTVTTENDTSLDIVYEFTIYTGDSWVFEEGHGFSVYYWIPVKKVDYTLFALDLMISVVVVTLIVFEDKLNYRWTSSSFYSRVRMSSTSLAG